MNIQLASGVVALVAVLAIVVLALTGHCSAAVGPFSVH